MKIMLRICASIIIAGLLYILSAYLSKETILSYYKWSDTKQDWLAEYKTTKIKDKYKIVFINSDPGMIADREAGHRMVAACRNLGWEVHDFIVVTGNEEEIKKIDPDFIFTNKWNLHIGLEKLKGYKVYALLPHPIATYFGGLLNFYPQFKKEKFPELRLLDGFVISSPQVSLFKNYIEGLGRKFYGFKGYSSVQSQDYVDVEPKELIYMGLNWDKKRKGNKFATVFKHLAEKDNAVFYGAWDSWEPLVGNSYQGYIEGDGSAVIDILRKHGINLILHSNQHIKNGAPSSRGFETAASGAIGISDQHPFLIENFGDNFLYININTSADKIIKQIEDHLVWIKENPTKVKEKTRKAYDIFMANYKLENLMLNVAHMHEKILEDQEKN
jgi:hypothetical protein